LVKVSAARSSSGGSSVAARCATRISALCDEEVEFSARKRSLAFS
jgi:hypothetical protein